jgi:hypothetical protein
MHRNYGSVNVVHHLKIQLCWGFQPKLVTGVPLERNPGLNEVTAGAICGGNIDQN